MIFLAPLVLPGEAFISGIENVRRHLSVAGRILLDARFGQALVREAGQKTLEWFYETLGITRTEFLGTIFARSDGTPCVLCVARRRDGIWFEEYPDLVAARYPKTTMSAFLGA